MKNVCDINIPQPSGKISAKLASGSKLMLRVPFVTKIDEPVCPDLKAYVFLAKMRSVLNF